eukprot:4509445-Karenia_brevis.AAC.1
MLGVSDDRGAVHTQSLRYINEIKPRAAIMENLKGITAKKFEPVLKGIKRTLINKGYAVKTKVLNSKKHAVAQSWA